MGWDGMGWDGMGWDGMEVSGWVKKTCLGNRHRDGIIIERSGKTREANVLVSLICGMVEWSVISRHS